MEPNLLSWPYSWEVLPTVLVVNCFVITNRSEISMIIKEPGGTAASNLCPGAAYTLEVQLASPPLECSCSTAVGMSRSDAPARPTTCWGLVLGSNWAG
jgi:hypothetical protein